MMEIEENDSDLNCQRFIDFHQTLRDILSSFPLVAFRLTLRSKNDFPTFNKLFVRIIV